MKIFYYIFLIAYCVTSVSAQYKAESLGTNVNSSFDETSVFLSADATKLYFCRSYASINNDPLHIYMSALQPDNSWSKPVLLSDEINNENDTRICGMTLDGNKLFVQGNYLSSNQLYYSEWDNDGFWSKPSSIRIVNEKSTKDMTFQFADEGKMLLFSKPSTTKGLNKIFVSFNVDNIPYLYDTPIDLGSTINTHGNISGMCIASDNKTIFYFQETNEKQVKLFQSIRQDATWTKWSTPVKLEIENIEFDKETNYCYSSFNGNYLYFAASNTNGNNKDLYRIELENKNKQSPTCMIMGKIVDANNKELNTKTKVKYKQVRFNTKTTICESKRGAEFCAALNYYDDYFLYADDEKGIYYTPLLVEMNGRNIEEIDYDGDPLLAQSEGAEDASGTNSKIESLQLKIAAIDSQMIELSSKIKEFKAIETQKVQVKFIKDDAELDKLYKKYTNYKKRLANAPYQDTEVQSIASANNSDKEIQMLKDKYAKANGFVNAEHSKKKATEEQVKKNKEDLKKEVEADWAKKITRELEVNMIDAAASSIEDNLDDDGKELLAQIVANRKKQNANYDDIANANIKPNSANSNDFGLALEKEIQKSVKEDLSNSLTTEVVQERKKELRIEMEYVLKQMLRKRYSKELDLLTQNAKENESKANIKLKSIVPKDPKKLSGVNVKQEISVTIKAYKTAKNTVISLQNIFFDMNTDRIKEESYFELEKIAAFLKNNPEIVKMQIAVHTNGWASIAFAENLTKLRAQKIIDYLVANHKIDKSKFEIKASGNTIPITSNQTLEGRRTNQRVELKILQIN
jgi:outer membrane protein OmpA-like peptidoglycan-associated protein